MDRLEDELRSLWRFVPLDAETLARIAPTVTGEMHTSGDHALALQKLEELLNGFDSREVLALKAILFGPDRLNALDRRTKYGRSLCDHPDHTAMPTDDFDFHGTVRCSRRDERTIRRWAEQGAQDFAESLIQLAGERLECDIIVRGDESEVSVHVKMPHLYDPTNEYRDNPVHELYELHLEAMHGMRIDYVPTGKPLKYTEVEEIVLGPIPTESMRLWVSWRGTVLVTVGTELTGLHTAIVTTPYSLLVYLERPGLPVVDAS